MYKCPVGWTFFLIINDTITYELTLNDYRGVRL